MSAIISKAKTFLWFLQRPKYYSQLYTLAIQRISGNAKENTREVSEKWCKEQALPTNEFIQKNTSSIYDKLEAIYPDIFQNAQNIVDDLPVKMGGAGDIELLYFLSEHIKARKVIETGVAHGWSSLALLLSLSKRENTQLISTDMPYPKMNNEDYVGCVVPKELEEQWKIIRQADKNALPKALASFEVIDLCHYDSDKTYQGRMWAYPLLWDKLRTGGIFISDDIGDNVAFRDFCESIGKIPFVINTASQYVGVLIKDD